MENILLEQILIQVKNKEISIEKARELICVLFETSNNTRLVFKSFICYAEEKGGSRCEIQCIGCNNSN